MMDSLCVIGSWTLIYFETTILIRNVSIIVFKHPSQRRIRDSLYGGRQLFRGGGAPTYKFAEFSEKLHEIQKISGRQGARAGYAPL